MTSVKVHLRETIRYVLLLGVVVQGVLGVLAAACWIFNAPSFGNAIKSLLGVLLGFLLCYLFLRVWCKEKKKWMYFWGSVGMISIPVVLQTCLDAGSEWLRVMLLCLVFIFCLGLSERVKVRGKRIAVKLCGIILAAVICFAGSGAPSLAAGLMSRCSFPSLYYDIYNIPPELREKLDFDVLWEATYRTDGMHTIFYPDLLERYNSSRAADGVCLEIAGYCFKKNTGEIVKNSLWDVAGYHFPMLVSEMQLQGHGYDAVTAVNYDDFIKKTDRTGALYWNYGAVWNLLSLVVLLGLCRRCPRNGQGGFFLLFLEVCVCCLVMEGAGYFDYKNLLLAEFVRMGLLLEILERLHIERDITL